MLILTHFQHRHDEVHFQKYWNREADRWLPLDTLEQIERYVHADALIIDQENEDIIGFCERIEGIRSKTDMPIIVLFPERFAWSNQWDRFCRSHRIEPLFHIEKIDRETIHEIESLILDPHHAREQKQVGKSIMFTGTTPNIGTTVAAFGTALQLAKVTEQTIAYLCLNLKSSKIGQYIGNDDPPITLDQLRTDLKTTSLSPERLRQMARPVKNVPNLHVLYGNEYREQAEFYTPDDMKHLLQTVSETYDVCIIDVNAYWDNAATIVAALHADIKIAVTRNHRAYFQKDFNKWLLSSCSLIGLSPQSFDLFVTQYDENGYRLKDIRKDTGINVIGKMKRYAKLDSFADHGELIRFFESEEQVVRELSSLTRLIQSSLGWARCRTAAEKKKWLHKLWPAAYS